VRLTAGNTAIVLDSTADLPDAAGRFPNWRVVPLYVRFGDESLRDGVDIDAAEFYARLRESSVFPTTSQPTPGDFLACYGELGAYERVLSLHVSARVSGTFASAEAAAAELGDGRVRAIDTETASASIALLALAIQRRLERGTSDEEADGLIERYRRERGLFLERVHRACRGIGDGDAGRAGVPPRGRTCRGAEAGGRARGARPRAATACRARAHRHARRRDRRARRPRHVGSLLVPLMTSSRIWIGGGTGGGKSTTARGLAVRHGLRRFAIDSFWYAYEARSSQPRKSPDEQWLETPPEIQALEFEETSRMMMRCALDDLALLPDVPTVVEGPQILPDLVPQGEQAVFLDPTPEWQRSVLEPRPMPSSDPARALEARLVKDRLYADRVAALASDLGFPVLVTDGSRDLVAEVESLLDVPKGTADLRVIRRWENETAAAWIRAWVASPEGAPEHDGYPYACECGRRGCDELVQLTLEEFDAAQQVVAHP
jgi:hypothetical protein